MPTPAFTFLLPVSTPTAIAAGSPPRRHRLSPSICSTVASLYSPPRTSSTPLLHSGSGLPPPPSPRHRRRDWYDDDSNNNSNNETLSPFPQLIAHLSNLLRLYNRSLATAPLPTKAASAGLLVLLSDLLAQTLANSQVTDLPRLFRHLVYGFLIAGPQGHYWFTFLDRFVRLPGAQGVFAKVLLDQLAFSPFALAGFFGLMKLAEGAGIQRSLAFVKDKLGPTIVDGWKIWPLVNAFNFSVVPTQHRVVFTSAVSVFWIAFLSVVANREGSDEQPQDDPVPLVIPSGAPVPAL